MVGCAGPHFALERWTLFAPHTERVLRRRCLTLSNVGNPVRLDYQSGTETLARGESCILPAALGEVTITPSDAGEVPQLAADGAASLVVCYVPELATDIVARLRTAGHTDAAIATLGEVPL